MRTCCTMSHDSSLRLDAFWGSKPPALTSRRMLREITVAIEMVGSAGWEAPHKNCGRLPSSSPIGEHLVLDYAQRQRSFAPHNYGVCQFT